MKTVLTLALIASLAAVSTVEAQGRPHRAKKPGGDPTLSAGAMKGGSAPLLGGSPAPRARHGAPRSASAGAYSNLGETTLLPGAGGGPRAARPARRPKNSPY